MQFEDIVADFMQTPHISSEHHSPAGKAYLADNPIYKGYYWFYENDRIVVDIHNFFIKEDMLHESIDELSLFSEIALLSTYMMSASGEIIHPYRTLEPNTMIVGSTHRPIYKHIFHKNSRLMAVGIKYKVRFFEEERERLGITQDELATVFLETSGEAAKRIAVIARDIYDCRMKGRVADLFFEAKALEWLTIALDAYEARLRLRPLSEEDAAALDTVARYIDDHYAFDLSLDFLCRLAMMSRSKLKERFKTHYGVSVTEYMQRRRINVAENLLLSSDLPIGDVARAVGYQSLSRFSTLYKRYKGILPKEVRAIELMPE